MAEGGPDEVFECTADTNGHSMVFASGVGTDTFHYPYGVAKKVPAGTQLLLNLHLFNTSDEPLSGVSGTQIKTVSAASVEHEAEVVFAGSVAIELAPNSTGTARGSCKFVEDATIVSVWPHMHQLGTHMTVVHEGGEGDTVLHDADFEFDEQVGYVVEPKLVLAGESVSVECSYQNTSANVINFGYSSEDEMCLAGLTRYPASDASLFCDLL